SDALAGCGEKHLLDHVANVIIGRGLSGTAPAIKVERIVNLHHVPFTRTWVIRMFSGVPGATQTAWLSCSRTGAPPAVTRNAPVTQLAVTQGGLGTLARAHPAMTQGAVCVTMGWPPTVTRGKGAVAWAWPPWAHMA